MTTFKSINLGYDVETGIPDAFGRLRISPPQTLFDSKQLYDNAPLFYDDAETSGTGTSSSHSTLTASTTMSVGATTAGTRVRQTFRRFNYEPGKSQLIFCTFVLGASESGVTRRVGYFDENNGLFVQLDDSTLSFVRRTSTSGSPVDNTVTQSSWNIDPLDGTGKSGITLDHTKTQILIIDFEWLGVGAVRMGFVIDGIIYYCHQFKNANNLDVVYMSTPNLPIRYEISNDGTGDASSLVHICSSVISEGGQQSLGLTQSIGRGTSTITTQNTADWTPLISLRLKSTHLSATVFPLRVDVLCTSTSDFEVGIFIAPTIAGVDAVSWQNLTNSAVQYDITRNNTNTLSGGTIIYRALTGSTSNQSRDTLGADLEPFLTIGSAIDSTPQEMVLAVRRLTGTTETFYASFTWQEVV